MSVVCVSCDAFVFPCVRCADSFEASAALNRDILAPVAEGTLTLSAAHAILHDALTILASPNIKIRAGRAGDAVDAGDALQCVVGDCLTVSGRVCVRVVAGMLVRAC